MEWISGLFEQYGYFVLFLGLLAESLALPFPGELAMAISGHMINYGSFNLTLIVLCSFIGAITGTLITYGLGYKLGTPFFEKYGKYFFMKPERISKIAAWFDKYGNKLILVSYFIPGLRHFTGYVSGILKVRLSTLLIYNSLGGIIWVFFYVTVGRLLGEQIEHLLHLISQYSIAALFIVGMGIVLLIVYKRNKAVISGWVRTKANALFAKPSK